MLVRGVDFNNSPHGFQIVQILGCSILPQALLSSWVCWSWDAPDQRQAVTQLRTRAWPRSPKRWAFVEVRHARPPEGMGFGRGGQGVGAK